ncbi:MAG TPA: ABC transporter ATP-binding protein [Hyphomicrobiales bacterium]|nr:ABC transporter ATP-binding protein [Hyphomicrobiales bacterium]
MAELRIDGICKNFGGLVVASDVTFTLSAGDRTALIGPNGAGKTTLVNLITGALKPSSGTISLDGKPLTRLSQPARAQAGIARTFQVSRLFRDQTVGDNLRIAIHQQRRQSLRVVQPRADADAVEAQVERILTALRLQHAVGREVRHLPYGEQRLLEIALALALEPRVLLLDEPAAGVPRGESEAIMEVVAALPADLAVLLIEHDMDLVFRFARKIIVLASGAVLTVGTPEAVAADGRVKQLYFGREHDEHRHVVH